MYVIIFYVLFRCIFYSPDFFDVFKYDHDLDMIMFRKREIIIYKEFKLFNRITNAIETMKILIIYVLCIIIRFVNQTKLHLVIHTIFCFLRCFPPIKFLLLFWRNASFSIIHVIYFKRKYNFVKVDQWNRMDVLVTCFELIMWCVRKHFRSTLTSYLFSLQRLDSTECLIFHSHTLACWYFIMIYINF